MFWRNIQKAISILVIFCLMIQQVPVYALDFSVFSNGLDEEKIKKDDIKTLYEITSKREEDKKYFKMSDGSEKVNLYAAPVHFKENGKYVDVDNELIKIKDTYENKKASYKVRYQAESNNNLLKLEKDGYSLSMSLLEGEKVKAIVSKDNSDNVDDLSKISSQIEYNNIKEKVDINYVTLPNKIKESIILKDKDASKEFKYKINLNKNLNAIVKEHNIIEFYDGENIVYSVETPYMYDNEFNLSSDIETILDKVDDGYILTIKPDEKWLNDKNRKYPVTIDPTVNTSQIRNQIDDLFIYEGDDNVDTYAKANQHILRVGSNNFSGTGQHPTRSLIRFNLPNLNTGDQVIDAKLGIYSYACGLEGVRCPNGKPIEINAHKVLKSWNDDNARWNYLGSDDSYDHKVIDYQVFNYDENDQVKLYQFDITSIAKDWYLSGENNGLMLKENNEINGLNREDAYFFSSDISDKYSNGRPIVSITYRNQTGTENYQTFSSHSVSDFNVNVNNYNGNLVLQHEDVSTPGGRLPALIKHVYNTNDKDINIGYGNGFRLNLNQTITTDSDYLRYIDEDGTRHFFKKEGNNYKDEDGLNLMIYSDGNDYRMEDKGGNKSYFSKKDNTWYLYKIVDTNGNQMVIDLDSNNFNRINKVTDGASDCLTFVYSNDKLSKILDTAGREVKFNYSDNNLISIVNKNNDIEKINYNNNLITKLTSFDNSYNTYEYYEKSPYRLKKISEYGSNGSLGSSLDFVYGENVTSITDKTGKKTNYVFNNLGQTTSITDLGSGSSVEEAYGQSFEFDTSEGDSKNKIKSEGKIISYASNSIPNVVVNGDAEEDNYYWDFVGNGVSFDTSEKYQGLKSFKFSAGYMTQPVTVEPGKTYKLSAYIKSNSSNNGKAYMSFSHDDSMNLETFDKTFNVTNEWREYSFNFTVPNGVLGKNKLTISSSSDNIIYFDDIKIEDESSNLYNPNNLINNGNFDKGLDDWTVQHFPGIDDGIVENQGNKVLKIAGEINSVKAYNQIINKSGTKGSTLNVSFWALNTGVSIDNLREAKVQVELLDSNGAILQSENLNVSNDSSSWQFINKYIVAKSNFSKVKITPSFFRQRGYILFDNISFYIDAENGSFTYDSKGNVVSSKNAALEKNDYSYDSLNQQISLLNNRGRTTLYSYDYNHRNRLLSMRSPDGMDSEYTYDNFGNKTSVKTYSKRDISKENIDQSEIYYIKSYTNDLYVTANGSVENSGTKLNLSPLKDDGTNEWNIVRTTNGKYVVKAARSRNETVWDVDGEPNYRKLLRQQKSWPDNVQVLSEDNNEYIEMGFLTSSGDTITVICKKIII